MNDTGKMMNSCISYEKVDELSETLEMPMGRKGGRWLIINRMEALEKEVGQLHGIIAAFRTTFTERAMNN